MTNLDTPTAVEPDGATRFAILSEGRLLGSVSQTEGRKMVDLLREHSVDTLADFFTDAFELDNNPTKETP